MTLWWLNCFSKDMASTKRGNEFRYYMHDGPHALSFELAGELSDNAARELEQAWRAASSVIGNRSLIVDLSYVTESIPGGKPCFAGGMTTARNLLPSCLRQD